MISLVATSTFGEVCQGVSCLEELTKQGVYTDESPFSVIHQLALKMQEAAGPIFSYILESAGPFSAEISAGCAGLFFANGLNNLARPKAGGMYVLGNFGFSALLGFYAYNKQAHLLSELFLSSALLLALYRIKNLETQCAASGISPGPPLN